MCTRSTDIPPAPTGQPRRWHAWLSAHRGVAALTTAALLAVGGFGGHAALAGGGGARERAADANAQPRLLAPADGALLVGTTKVPQMAGHCDGKSCYHVPSPTPPVVTSDAKTLHVKAGKSTKFTVNAFNLAHPRDLAALPVSGDDLLIGQLASGTYQVTLYGVPNGGAWEFRLVIPAAKS